MARRGKGKKGTRHVTIGGKGRQRKKKGGREWLESWKAKRESG